MHYLAGILLMAGLCISGSEGPYFPLINLLGLGCLWGAVSVARRV